MTMFPCSREIHKWTTDVPVNTVEGKNKMVSMRETETTWGPFLLYGTKSAGEEGLRPADKGIDMQKVLRRKQQEDSCES